MTNGGTGTAAATYFTVSDDAFFLGSVMLLNSLRLSGNDGRLVVLDAGLTSKQRARLEPHADVVSPPRTIDGNPCVMKPYPHLLDPSGVVVIIDSDIVVSGRLHEAIDLARDGKIVATPAWTKAARTRWFAEWAHVLALRAPLRREDWVQNGFVALSMDHWPHLLERWWELCELVPGEQAFVDEQPFNAPDADALNALLMSEIPPGSVALLPAGEEAFGGDIEILDVQSLRCTFDGVATRLIHYPDSPKPWQGRGWVRAGAPSYARIMRRLLFAPDVQVRLDPKEAPLWLRPSLRGRLALGGRAATNRSIRTLTRRLPQSAQNRLRDLRRAALGYRARPADLAKEA